MLTARRNTCRSSASRSCRSLGVWPRAMDDATLSLARLSPPRRRELRAITWSRFMTILILTAKLCSVTWLRRGVAVAFSSRGSRRRCRPLSGVGAPRRSPASPRALSLDPAILPFLCRGGYACGTASPGSPPHLGVTRLGRESSPPARRSPPDVVVTVPPRVGYVARERLSSGTLSTRWHGLRCPQPLDSRHVTGTRGPRKEHEYMARGIAPLALPDRVARVLTLRAPARSSEARRHLDSRRAPVVLACWIQGSLDVCRDDTALLAPPVRRFVDAASFGPPTLLRRLPAGPAFYTLGTPPIPSPMAARTSWALKAGVMMSCCRRRNCRSSFVALRGRMPERSDSPPGRYAFAARLAARAGPFPRAPASFVALEDGGRSDFRFQREPPYRGPSRTGIGRGALRASAATRSRPLGWISLARSPHTGPH